MADGHCGSGYTTLGWMQYQLWSIPTIYIEEYIACFYDALYEETSD